MTPHCFSPTWGDLNRKVQKLEKEIEIAQSLNAELVEALKKCRITFEEMKRWPKLQIEDIHTRGILADINAALSRAEGGKTMETKSP